MATRTAKAVIYRSQRRGKNGKRVKGFRFRLLGTNGQKIGTSQHYQRRGKVYQTLAKYHPDFEVIDHTAKK